MYESNLEKIIDQWLEQSRTLINDFFAAKQNNDTAKIEIIQTTVDKIAQQFINLLKIDMRVGGLFYECLNRTKDYFLETSDLSFDKMFEFESKSLLEIETEVKNQAIAGAVNIELDKRLAVLLTQIIKREINFLSLIETLFCDIKYPIRIVDKIRNSRNLVKWLKLVTVKIDRNSLSQKEYKEVNDLIDRMFNVSLSTTGKVKQSTKDKQADEDKEYVNEKILKFYEKSKEIDLKKKGMYANIIKNILGLQQFNNQKFTIHDVRNIFDFCNQVRYLCDEEKNILNQIKVILARFNKLINAAKYFSLYYLNNVEISIESENIVDVMVIQGKIKKVPPIVRNNSNSNSNSISENNGTNI